MDYFGEFSEFQNSFVGFETGLGSTGDRIPQWSNEETRDFLAIRAELDPNFEETKRNRVLWELVSTRMSEIGYNRTSIQCKCKWKNLVTRYKGCETMEEVEMRQSTFPYYNDMHSIFNARIQRMLWLEVESAFAAASSPPAALPSNVNDDDKKKRKRKEKAAAAYSGGGEANSGSGSGSNSSVMDGFKEILEGFINKQMEIEMQWMKLSEEREERRRESEMKWRQKMEDVEDEKLLMMRRWEEREEERKKREEAWVEKRDALFTALMKNLNDD